MMEWQGEQKANHAHLSLSMTQMQSRDKNDVGEGMVM
jgi:hypothetical protein